MTRTVWETPASLFDDFPVGEAVISDDQVYRYVLNRRWAAAGPVMSFIGLNPSKADAKINDPTVHRMCWFAKREGCCGICVLNLHGLRATDPAELTRHPDPVGPDNDQWLSGLRERADGPVVAAWGAHPFAAPRIARVLRLLDGVDLVCLGITAGGHPKHPLARGRHRIPDDAPLIPWLPAAVQALPI